MGDPPRTRTQHGTDTQTHKHTTPLPSPRPHPAHTTTPRRPERNRQLAREIERREMWTEAGIKTPRWRKSSPRLRRSCLPTLHPPQRRADRPPLIHNAKAVSNKESEFETVRADTHPTPLHQPYACASPKSAGVKCVLAEPPRLEAVAQHPPQWEITRLAPGPHCESGPAGGTIPGRVMHPFA